MGCISSKADINDQHPNIFNVKNRDEAGTPISQGQLEITETDLIFYERGKVPKRWPLRSLRRYGFDAEIFSFEAGRRCPSGAGIFEFQCSRAEALFNLLQVFLKIIYIIIHNLIFCVHFERNTVAVA
jgi:fibroblast growth factor receptor substrate 2